ncbi:MAG: FHA domain-containing protein, partial [Myxococcota bacterium]
APVAAPAGATASGSLVLIRPDGSEGERFDLQASTVIGREAQGPFASDSYLSPQHAEFHVQSGSARVVDLESLNGVYVRIQPDTPTELSDGSIFRIGQEILAFEQYNAAGPDGEGTVKMGSKNVGYVGRIRLVIGRESYGNSFPIGPHGMHMGRERGDVIFPEDGYVSGLHCRVHGDGGKVLLTDVGSSNGTFVRVRGEATIASGTLLLMGQQLFRLEC